ncbi:heavy metal-associated isoprenylated plant protein 33-like [Miscanthus floridulus]|uniref:heavy metal-associated isoprenylated plant protein 33-like n=1 Tax=Miscanthus floridulus TaxID=154761 RepID=UPI0034580AE0
MALFNCITSICTEEGKGLRRPQAGGGPGAEEPSPGGGGPGVAPPSAGRRRTRGAGVLSRPTAEVSGGGGQGPEEDKGQRRPQQAGSGVSGGGGQGAAWGDGGCESPGPDLAARKIARGGILCGP